MPKYLLILALMLPSGQIEPRETLSPPISKSECQQLVENPAIRSSYLEDYWEGEEVSGQPVLVCSEYGTASAFEAVITGYYAAPEALGALGEKIRPGGTAAISPACMNLLGKKVYISGHGIWRINDLTHPRLDEERRLCTVDLAKSSVDEARKVGNNTARVVVIE